MKSVIKSYLIKLFFTLGYKEAKNDGILTTFKNIVLTKSGRENGPAREKWIQDKINELNKGESILDAGAGELKYKPFCGHLKYTSQDFGGYDGVGTGEGVQMGNWDNSKLDIVSDIVKIPVPDSSFDNILCVEVFEHISEPALAVKEFSRIIKKGGKVIITAPFCSLNHFAPYYYANGYSKYWYEKILSQYGFEIEEIKLNGNYFMYLAQEISYIKERMLKYSKVNLLIWSIFKISQLIMLQTLRLMSKNDTGSSELLCFGVFVLARKK